MRRYLFVLLCLPLFATAGTCQVAGSAWTNVFSVDVNLAFGPKATATWDPSIGFLMQINDRFRVGIGDVSYGTADLLSGTRRAIMGGPVVELLLPASEYVSYSIHAGVPLQNRWGAGIAHSFGAAPYGSGAIDYHFSPVFSLAGIVRVQYLATEAYLRSPRVLPSSALIIALGVGFHFYF
jgi:hypothetical protein